MVLPLAPLLTVQDPKPLLVRALVGGAPVAATLSPDGILVVSGRGGSYQGHVATAREAATALVRALGRLNASNASSARSPRVAPGGPVIPMTVPGLPSGAQVSLPTGYVYRTNDRIRPFAHWFTNPSGPTVFLVMGVDPARPADPHDPSARTAWLVTGRILGKTLAVRGRSEGGLAVRYAPPEAIPKVGRVPLVATDEATPRAAVVAIFAALTYRSAS